ncbi:MAG: hypothetical protein ABSG29_14230 [Steroidobacteraceae bacterium]|jgi:hypothetical protein
MRFSQIFRRLGLSGGWSRELWLTGITLAAGFGLMPLLIYFLGSSLLGRYEGASVLRIFGSLYGGLRAGSAASWIVLLGPYGLYLGFRGLRFLWRASARLA